MVARLGVLESKLWNGRTTDGKIKPLYLANNNEVTTNLSRAMEIAEDKANDYPDWKFKPLKTIESFAGDIILEVEE